MNLFLTLGLPLEAYKPDTKPYTVIRYEGCTVYDYAHKQDYHFHGEGWSERKQLFMKQYAALKPEPFRTDHVRILKETWKRTKGGKLKAVS